MYAYWRYLHKCRKRSWELNSTNNKNMFLYVYLINEKVVS